MASSVRIKVRMVSTADTGYYYTTTTNKRNKPEKLRLKKYDPKAGKHVEFEEKKIK